MRDRELLREAHRAIERLTSSTSRAAEHEAFEDLRAVELAVWQYLVDVDEASRERRGGPVPTQLIAFKARLARSMGDDADIGSSS